MNLPVGGRNGVACGAKIKVLNEKNTRESGGNNIKISVTPMCVRTTNVGARFGSV